MPDVQASRDSRRVAIDRVGVTDIRFPIALATPDGGELNTVATVNLYVSLAAEHKGTHMSRFLEVLHGYDHALQPSRIPELAERIRSRLGAEKAVIEMEMPYFIAKIAPVSKQTGLMDYEVGFSCERTADHTDLVMRVTAPATSLCPCSKEISEYGAHNQRCLITAEVRTNEPMWIEEIVDVLERAASCPVYSVLKRSDEKFVTEAAFDNPKFVEDTVRDLALALEREDRVTWFTVRSKNMESIHSHNAYAEIIRDKRG